MSKRIALKTFVLLFYIPLGTIAQQGAEMGRENPILKISFLPMFHVDNAFVVAGEIPLAKGRFSLQPEIGYGTAHSNIWYAAWTARRNIPEKRTLRTKLQFRSYFKEGRVFRGYFGGEYAYRHSNFQQEREELSTEPLRLQRSNHSMHGIMGWQGYSTKRLTIDLQFGFGLRISENRALTQGLTQAERNNVRINERGWFWRNKELGSFGPYPSFIGAVQLGFVLGKLQ
jgi:hypothetical protein